MKKLYIDANSMLRDAWRLGRLVLDSGWRPDALVALWRGGAFPGVAIHEFLKVNGLDLPHFPVVCSSYTGIDEHGGVSFRGAGEVLDSFPAGSRILVVDDVFDSGDTARAVRSLFSSRKCEARIACVYWKRSRARQGEAPDFHVRECDDWIVFPHEIEGLASGEIAAKDPLLADLMA